MPKRRLSAFLLLLTTSVLALQPGALRAEIAVVEMLNGERIVLKTPLSPNPAEGRQFVLLAQPLNLSETPRLIRVADVASIERAKYIEANNLLNNPCAWEWQFTLRGEARPFRVNQPFLLEMPAPWPTLSDTLVKDLQLRGATRKDALAYDSRFIPMRCMERSNFEASGLPVTVIDPVTGEPSPKQLNLLRLRTLAFAPDTALQDELTKAREAKIRSLPDLRGSVAALPPPRTAAPTATLDTEVKRDVAGLRIVQGPVGPGFYSKVRIVSSTVGVDAYATTTIVDSVIEAPVCVRSTGQHLLVRNNVLKCGLCVEFTGGPLIDNTLSNNRCIGRGTNRPEVFGW